MSSRKSIGKSANSPEQRSAIRSISDKHLQQGDFENASNAEDAPKRPVLRFGYNVVSHTQTVMSGSVVQVIGDHLTFDRLDRRQGLYLKNTQQGLTKITMLVRNKPENVIFMVPGGVSAGTYELELRTVCEKSGELYTSLLPNPLTVID